MSIFISIKAELLMDRLNNKLTKIIISAGLLVISISIMSIVYLNNGAVAQNALKEVVDENNGQESLIAKDDVRLTSFQPDGDSSYLLHLIAQEKGYFTEAGINLIFQQGGQEDNAAQSGDPLPKSDLYLMGRAMVYAVESANPGLLKVFNINTQDNIEWNDAILVKKDSNIASLSQLEKKSVIGLMGGGPARVPLMEKLLKENGLNPVDFNMTGLNHVKISSMDNPAERIALIDEFSSEMDVVYAREPILSLLLENENWNALIDGPLFAKNIFNPWPMTMTLFSAEFAKENSALASKIISVYDKTIDFIAKNPEQARLTLSNYAEIKYGARDLNVRPVNYSVLSNADKDLIQKQSDWYFEKGLINNKISAENLLFIK